MKNILLESKEKKSRSEIVAFLKELAEKIDSGTVTFLQGEESLDLEIPEKLTLELEVQEKEKEHKPKKMQIEIELEWYLGEKSESIELG
ncbi:MAG: amphi-Trp domain-containing protein [Asgard group archaeon]|nr:amphi-Trp domain-containing protein [Asgard group archaeon]